MEISKPLILSIDTSAVNCTVVISEAEKVLVSYTINIKKLHDRLLADFVKRALNDLSLNFSKINTVAFSSGPGSFTGLRIGASFVKGLTIHNQPKFLALPTLQIFAIQSETLAKALGKTKIIPLIAANSGMIYAQEFDLTSTPLSEPKFLHSDELIIDKDAFYCGDGKNNFPQLNSYPVSDSIQADSLAKLAFRNFSSNNFSDSEAFEPEYIQEFVFKG